jgi:hypothetical protein
MSRFVEAPRVLAAIPFALVLVTCGGTTVTQENGPRSSGNETGSEDGQSPGASSGGTTAGGGVPGAGGPGSVGPSGMGAGAGDGSVLPEGGNALGPDGTGTPRGCELGTSCTPGDDLAPPDPADGFQIVTPPGMFTVQPNQETVPNYCVTLPNTAEFDVGTVQSWMTPDSSYELIVYQGGTAALDAGTQAPCTLGADRWLYASSGAGRVVELKMPDGVGVPLPAGTQIVLDMHFINVSSSPTHPQVKVNLLRARNMQFTAASLVSFNSSIDIPGATAAGAGTQTVKGTCTANTGSNFFVMGTHTHGHATVADVNFVSGGQSTNIVHTTDWRNPDVAVWTAPQFLTLGAGDSLTYACSYSNSGMAAVTVGETQASNESCMAVGYYFPAGSTSCD